MSIRTDLALERTKIDTNLDGISQYVRDGIGCKITEIVIESPAAAARIGKGIGRYITLEVDDLSIPAEEFDGMVLSLSKEITELLSSSKKGDVFVVGLGNRDITPDALGTAVAAKIIATRHLSAELPSGHELSSLRAVSALAPGVLGQTGIEAAEIAKAICESTNPAAVIIIDALACADISRLGRTIQLSDTGISPGSGVKNSRKELSKATLGVPVISIGVPTVVDTHTIIENLTGTPPQNDLPNMMVSPRDIDKVIERAAKLVAFAINSALQPSFSLEDIAAMI
ncbi:MAG: GPR endopeptidase [Oscillospiraceae bacterium]